MSNRDKNELTATTQDDLARKDAIARVLDKARASGLCPDDHHEKAFMDVMWGAEPALDRSLHEGP